MVFDWDDQSPQNDAMPYMRRLHEINPKFKATLFAIPALGRDSFWDSHPDWIELAVHGWLHPSPYECADWTWSRMWSLIMDKPRHFVQGFKAPGWQISDDCYAALRYAGWWVADQHLEDHRRPKDLPVYFYEDGNWHGHTHNVCGNGIEETWDEVAELVRGCQDFQFASEAARVRPDRDDQRKRQVPDGVPAVGRGADVPEVGASDLPGRGA